MSPEVLLHPDYVFLFKQDAPFDWGSLMHQGDGFWSLEENGRLTLLTTPKARQELARLVEQQDVLMLCAHEFHARLRAKQVPTPTYVHRN